MPYNTDNVPNSKLAHKILRELATSQDGAYGTEIAQKLDTTQQVVSEIISVFKKLNIVEKGKRTKAQYYVLTDYGEEYYSKISKATELREKAEKLEKQAYEMTKSEEK